MRRVLITGGGGFTGRLVLADLLNHGYQCIALRADLMSIKDLRSELSGVQLDYVIHLAAQSFVGAQDHGGIYKTNVVGTTNLLDVLAETQHALRKVIVASSAAVYGNRQGQMSEDSALEPTSHYGCSKLAMERMVANYEGLVSLLITRPFNYTGVGHADRFVVPKIVAAVKAGKGSLTLGDTSVRREFNDVRDVVVWYRRLLEADSRYRTVNICSGSSISLREVIDLISEMVGRPIVVNTDPLLSRTGEIEDLLGDPTRLHDLTGYKPNFTLADTLSWMLRG